MLSAAISHVLVNGVEWGVLIPQLGLPVGDPPRIVVVLTLIGRKMLGLSPQYVGIIGAGLESLESAAPRANWPPEAGRPATDNAPAC